MKCETVCVYRDQGKRHYNEGLHAQAMQSCSKVTREAGTMSDQNQVLATLFGNRFSTLLMFGAHVAASKDFMTALATMTPMWLRLSSSNNNNDLDTSQESNVALRFEILCRCSRANLKAGNMPSASSYFEDALNNSKSALMHNQVTSNEIKNKLINLLTDAMQGKQMHYDVKIQLTMLMLLNQKQLMIKTTSSKISAFEQCIMHVAC